jgi:hypothetical protein
MKFFIVESLLLISISLRLKLLKHVLCVLEIHKPKEDILHHSKISSMLELLINTSSLLIFSTILFMIWMDRSLSTVIKNLISHLTKIIIMEFQTVIKRLINIMCLQSFVTTVFRLDLYSFLVCSIWLFK